MEFPFDINNLFGHEISLIDSHLTAFKAKATTCNKNREYKSQLYTVLDRLGEASAKAQGLHGAITSAKKLEYTDHHLYIAKDAAANNGLGTVVGLLKVGRKRLFIYDHNGGQHEMTPFCVLDFYVHESRQRMGCGKRLFQHMLREENVKPQHLAIDRPSHKFLSFLHKHYNIRGRVPQVNNFVVFEGFFRDRPPEGGTNGKRNTGRPPLHPYSRQNSRVVSGDAYKKQSPRQQSGRTTIPLSQLDKEDSARAECSVEHVESLLTDLHLDEPGQTDDDTETVAKEMLRDVSVARSDSQRTMYNGLDRSSSNTPSSLQVRSTGCATPAYLGMAGLQTGYSRHLDATPPPSAGQLASQQSEKLAGADSAKTNRTERAYSPPMLRRAGPSQDYMRLLHNGATTSASRRPVSRGSTHPPTSNDQIKNTKTTRTSPQSGPLGSSSGQAEGYSGVSRQQNTSWNIFGVPTRTVDSSPTKTRGYLQNRLW